MKDIEGLAKSAIDCAFVIHRELEPGLLKTAYEALMAQALVDLGSRVERQKPIPLVYKGVRPDEAFRADLLVESVLLIELSLSSGLRRCIRSKSSHPLGCWSCPLGY